SEVLKLLPAESLAKVVPSLVAVEALPGRVTIKPTTVVAFDDDRLAETANRAIRLVETLEALRERLMVIQNHIDTRAAQRRERQGYVLSVAAAIFLPLGFLTGLFGVNVAGMPGTSSPAAFTILSLGMVLVGAGLLWFFRSRDWL
ncbi:MAG: CorA family divalent cation transporter, partial [Paracoccaceae bacterium]